MRTFYSWANQTRMLAQQLQNVGSKFGAMFINAFKPAVIAMNNFLSAVTTFAENVLNALGKIFGWEAEVYASGVPMDSSIGMLADDLGAAGDAADGLGGGAGDAAKGLGDAADNAKKLKQQLQGFDKLNLLTTNADSGSGGGSGGSGSGGGSGGSGGGGTGGGGANGDGVVTVAFNKTKTAFESEIDSLYELGEYIGNTLKSVMEDIDWDSVYKGAEDFGKNFAMFLNGLISPELFYDFGKTVAGALNTALHAAFAFGDNFNFRELGVSIASSINGFFQNFDFGLLADTIDVWVQGIKDTIQGFLDTISLKDMVKAALDFGSHLDLETIEIVITGLVLTKGAGLLWGKFATFKDALLNFSGIGALGTVGTALSALTLTLALAITVECIMDTVFPDDFEKPSDKVIEELEQEHENLTKWLKDHPLIQLTFESLIDASTLGNPQYWITQAITKPFKDLTDNPNTLSGQIWDSIKEGLKDAFTIDDGEDWLEIGEDIVWGIANGILGVVSTPIAFSIDLLNWFVEGFKSLFKIHSPSKHPDIIAIGQNIMEGIVEAIREFVKKPFQLGADLVGWITESLGIPKGEDVVIGIKATWKTTKENVNTWWTNTKNWWGEKAVDVKSAYQTAKTTVQGWWTNTKEWFGNNKFNIDSKFETAKSTVQGWWGNVKKWFGSGKLGVNASFSTSHKSTAAQHRSAGLSTKDTNLPQANIKAALSIDVPAKPILKKASDGISTALKKFPAKLGLTTESKGKKPNVSVNGKIESVTDALPGNKKVINNTTASVNTLKDDVRNKLFGGGSLKVNKLTDAITPAGKVLNNGNIILKSSTDALSKAFKNVNKGNITYSTSKDNLSAKHKNIDKGNITLVSKKMGSAFDYTVDNMISSFTSHNKGKGFSSTIGEMKSSFKYRTLANGFDKTIYGMTAQFKYKSFANSFSKVIGGFTAVFSKAMNTFTASGGVFSAGRWRPVQAYANGGYVNTNGYSSAQLFVAREAGPELVGTIGNHSAVMNNDQIVASVSAGVYRANSEQNSLLRQQNQLLQAILQKETGISTRDVFNAVQSENRRYYARTGKNALVY